MKQLNLVKNTTGLCSIVLMTTLVACGGGGSGEGSSSSSNNSSQAPVVTTPDTPVIDDPGTQEPTVIDSTDDLVVADPFLFQSNYKLDVQVNVDSDYDYLTICYANESGEPNYADCLLRTDLDEGAVTSELLLTNDTYELVVIAWDYADVNNPAVSTWNRQLDGDLLQVN